MEKNELQRPRSDGETAIAGQFSGEAGPADAPAWEEVAAGRYMPRRFKGSFKGHALG